MSLCRSLSCRQLFFPQLQHKSACRPSRQQSQYPLSASNFFYLTASSLSSMTYFHSAILYIWMWSEIRSVWDMYILPDWLNIFGSFLYWLSASQYTYQQPNSMLIVRRIELFASTVEVIAIVGWCLQWYWEYYADLATIPLSCVGRGFTLDDPGITTSLRIVFIKQHRIAISCFISSDFLSVSLSLCLSLFLLSIFIHLVNYSSLSVCSDWKTLPSPCLSLHLLSFSSY